MQDEADVKCLFDEFVEVITVVDWELVDFKDENFIREVEQEEREGTDKIEQGYDAAKSHGNDDDGNHKGISFLNGIDIIIIQLYIFLFSLA